MKHHKLSFDLNNYRLTNRDRSGIPIPFRFRYILRSESVFRSVFRVMRINHFRLIYPFQVFYIFLIPRFEIRYWPNSELEWELKLNTFYIKLNMTDQGAYMCFVHFMLISLIMRNVQDWCCDWCNCFVRLNTLGFFLVFHVKIVSLVNG